MTRKGDIPPKIEDRSSTKLVVEEAFFKLDEAPVEDGVLLAASGSPLL